MEQKKITALMVVDATTACQGVVHLHDLWGVELVEGAVVCRSTNEFTPSPNRPARFTGATTFQPATCHVIH